MTYTTPGGTVNMVSVDILTAEHSLIAGTTGAGKSVLLNSVLCDFHKLNSPVSGAAVYIDFKRVELIEWKELPHCIAYCCNADETRHALKAVRDLMFLRYSAMQKTAVKKSDETPLYIFVDEMAFLLQDAPDLVGDLSAILRLGRAANIHLVAATQSPNRKSLPAELAQNFTCCVALRCRSSIESRQIIGIGGAEKLPVYGSGILWDKNGYRNIKVPLTPEDEKRTVIKYWQTSIFAAVMR